MQPNILKELFLDINSLGVNIKLSKNLNRLLGTSVLDLLWHKPNNFIERTFHDNSNELIAGEHIIIKVAILRHIIPYKYTKAPYKIETILGLRKITLIFFNYNKFFLREKFALNKIVVLSGKIEEYQNKLQITHPEYLNVEPSQKIISDKKIIYGLGHGINMLQIRKVIIKALNKCPNLDEWNDKKIINNYNWPRWKEALSNLHNPRNISDVFLNSNSHERLAYDELLATQLTLQIVRNNIIKEKGNIYKNNKNTFIKKSITNFEYELTNDQKITLKEILVDLKNDKKMLRLLHGDVGCGKTIIAILSMLYVAEAGYQVAIMAPTELLVNQHYKNVKEVCANININIEILASSSKNKKEILNNLKNGNTHFVIGTHALIQDDVKFKNLSYIVIDEQHRFGVNQRLSLRNKGHKVDMLLMSATPIPRSLLLASYGDIDVSTIKEKPKIRKETLTIVKPMKKTTEVIDAIKRAVNNNQKVYWVCPMIEEDENTEIANVEKRYKILAKIFKDKVEFLHGKIDPEKKEHILHNFINGKTQILVSTIVIEVGIDVPSASVMIIEQTERFGLAQMHQLRGRIGRGKDKSTCILLYASNIKDIAKQRLNIMRSSNDGFFIAEKDLVLRGGGEILGKKQSGQEGFVIFNLEAHKELIEVAFKDAENFYNNDPGFNSERGKNLINLLYIFRKKNALELIYSG